MKSTKTREEVNRTREEVELLKTRYTELEEDYLGECANFNPDSSAQALNKLASALKAKAKGLASLDFLFSNLNAESPQHIAFGAACALQVRPAFHAIDRLVSFLSELMDSNNLNGYRLKTVYRLLMAVGEIVKINSGSDVELLSEERTESVRVMLTKVTTNPRCQDDDTAKLANRIMQKL